MDNIKLNTVISAIKACTGSELKGYRCSICPYVNRCNGMIQYAMLDDALALLKAQEPKLVTNIHKEHNNVLNPNVPWVGKCPKCGKKIEGRNLTRFCKFCGQAVKWE